jgi:hypothetical protein
MRISATVRCVAGTGVAEVRYAGEIVDLDLKPRQSKKLGANLL